MDTTTAEPLAAAPNPEEHVFVSPVHFSAVSLHDHEIFYLHAAWGYLAGPARVAHAGLGKRLETLQHRCYESPSHVAYFTHEEALLLLAIIHDRGVARLARVVYPPKNGARSFTTGPQTRYVEYLRKKLQDVADATSPFREPEPEFAGDPADFSTPLRTPRPE